MITRTVKALLAMLLLGALALVAAPAAEAHAELKSSNPAEGASLSAAPTAITLTFDDSVTVPNDAIKVTGPDGAVWQVGTPRADGSTVTAPVQPSGPAGAYTLVWQMRADDGDIVSGSIPFTLTSPAGSSAASDQNTNSQTPVIRYTGAPRGDSATPVWVWGLVALVVAGVVVAVVRRRRRSTTRV